MKNSTRNWRSRNRLRRDADRNKVEEIVNERPPNRWRVMRVIMAVLALNFALMVPVPGADADSWLITPEEAAMAPAAQADPLQGGEHFAVGREDMEVGPVITVEKPKIGVPQNSPIEIVVKFVPRSHPVDLSTLEVELVKFINIDITDRVAEHTTEQGIQLKEANVPLGSHRVRIALADTTGAVSVREFLFEVI